VTRWPGGVVYYTIGSGIANKPAILEAIAEVESKTSVKFVNRTLQKNYVTFYSGRGASSSLGMIGGLWNIVHVNSLWDRYIMPFIMPFIAAFGFGL
jgi:hypothetical protein